MPVLFEYFQKFALHALRQKPTDRQVSPYCLRITNFDGRDIPFEDGINLIFDTLPRSLMENVLRLHFAINDEARIMYHREIVRYLNTTRTQVQNAKAQAMHKIRTHPSRRALMASYLRYPIISVYRRTVPIVSYGQLLDLKALAQAARTIEENQEIKLSPSVFHFIEQADAPLAILADSITARKTTGKRSMPKIRQDLIRLLEIAQQLRSTV